MRKRWPERLHRLAAGQGDPVRVCYIRADTGWVSVGRDHDTAAFAMETIRRWWTAMGAPTYPSGAAAGNLARLEDLVG